MSPPSRCAAPMQVPTSRLLKVPRAVIRSHTCGRCCSSRIRGPVVGRGASIQTNELPTGQHVFRAVAQSDCGEVCLRKSKLMSWTPTRATSFHISDTTLCSENLVFCCHLILLQVGGNEETLSGYTATIGGWGGPPFQSLTLLFTEPLSSGQYVSCSRAFLVAACHFQRS